MSKTIKIHTCPLAEVKITAPCKVRTCIYNTKKNETGCMGSAIVGEPLDVDDPIMVLRSTSDLDKQMKEGAKRIGVAVAVHDYLVWCRDKQPQDYPFVQGYSNKRLKREVTRLAEEVFPYSLEKLGWNIGLVCATVHERWIKEYAESQSSSLTAETLLGLDGEQTKFIRSLFIRAAEKVATK